LPLEEQAPHGVDVLLGVVFGDRDRECEVGGSEADADHVVDVGLLGEFLWHYRPLLDLEVRLT
jgi:hypothetical protein